MILVMGAGGTVGAEVVKRLGEAGVRFRAGYRSRVKLERALGAGIEAVGIDLDATETLRPALVGASKVFVLTGNSPRQAEMETNLVREAGRAGVRHLVKVSVWGAEQEAFTFARIHRPIEKQIEASGMAWTFLRPNGFYQNLSNFFATSIRSQGTIELPGYEARISHVDARDVAAVAAKALAEEGHAGAAYDLSGPEALSYGLIAEKLTRVLGREIGYVDIPEAEFRKGMLASGAPEPLVDAMIDLMHYYIAGNASRVSPDVKRVTGRDPIRFDQFARDYADAFR
jgi:uncharacterized protein YbjT (DUF2867 family)